jgi:hypothetical protein
VLQRSNAWATGLEGQAAWQPQAIAFVLSECEEMEMRRIVYLTLVAGGIAMTGTLECRA